MFDSPPTSNEPSLARESDALELDGLSDVDLLQHLEQLEAACNALAAQRLDAIAAVSRRDTLDAWGFPHVAALLTARLRIAPAEAKNLTALAADLAPRRSLVGDNLPPRYPSTADAAHSGQINPAHARAITAAMGRLESHATPGQLVEVEQALVELATKAEPGRIAAAARYAMARFDPDGVEPSEEKLARRRGLTLVPRSDGLFDLHGVLTRECAAKLEAALSPLAAPAPADAHGPDTRRPAERRHDALLDLLDRFLQSGTLPDHGGVPLSLAVVMDLDDLRSRVGTAVTTHGVDLDVHALLRMAAELEIIPVVLSKADGIVAYGTAKRLATAAQTKALRARDRGCSFPDCTKPPEWTQRHHILEVFADDGETDIDNLTLVCGYHHRNFHRWGWSCLMIAGRPHWIPPACVDPHRSPLLNAAHDAPYFPLGV